MKQAGKKYKKSWVKHFLHFYRSKRSEIISVTAILHIVSHRQSHEGDDGLIWLRSDVGERKRIAGRLADEKKQPADTERRVTLGHVNKLLKTSSKRRFSLFSRDLIL